MPRLEVHRIPKVCYRAMDYARPRWRCLLVLINRSAPDLHIHSVRLIQRNGRLRRQRSLTNEVLAGCFLQGSPRLNKGTAAVMDLQEPADTDFAGTSLSIEVVHQTSHRHLLHREHFLLIPRDTRALRLPLVGPWMAANARADAHCLGMQFGFDFIKPDDLVFHEHAPQRKMELEEFASFGKAVTAPARGTVIAVENSQRDLAPTPGEVTFPQGAPPENRAAILGNYVILQLDSGECVFLAHFQQGSVRVKKGDNVQEGQMIGSVGNTGNTSGPHLHIEMLDGPPDLSRVGALEFEQSGLPFGFHGARSPTSGDSAALDACLVPDKGSVIAQA